MSPKNSKIKKLGARALNVFLHVVTLAIVAWGLGAVYYCFGLTALWAKITAMAIFIAGMVVFDWLVREKSKWLFLGLAVWLLIPIVVFSVRSIDETWQWQTPWAREPEISVDGNWLDIKNVRDFDYQKVDEFNSRYTEMKLDLNKLEGVLLGVSYWGGNTDIAHTMLGFYFSDRQAIVVSVETRKPIGASDSTLAGIYRQYGILHVFGTAHDLWKLRLDYRKEDLYVYPTNATPEEARILLLELCRRAENYKKNPKFYNTLTDNCTSSLVSAVRKIRPQLDFDIRFLINGQIDKFAFEKGWLMHEAGEDFAEVRRRAKRVSRLVVEASDQVELLNQHGKDVLLDRNALKGKK